MLNQNFQKTIFVLLFLISLTGCNFGFNKNEDANSNSQNIDTENKDTDITESSEKIENEEALSIIKVPQYFWGTWQRMDNGQYYVIDEDEVFLNNNNYIITSSSESLIEVNSLGNFEKQSDSVMVNNSIPYFRKGGTNLEYTMKLVGFEDDISRAAASSKISDFKVKGKSDKYKSFESDSNVSEDGTIKLTAPTAGDIQTVTVSSESDVVAVVPGITVETKGSNMGTIPISSKGQYSLKVTGTIPDEEKDDGYLYGNNYKSYPMTITITNISDVDSETSAISITPKSSNITIHSEDDSNLDLITVSTMKSGMSKTVKIFVECGSVSSGYLDTGINVTITNLKTRKQWIDFIPMRFYKGLVPLSIAAKSTESNSNAALNGFIIYPDGNNRFFAIPSGDEKTIFVPSFGLLQDYLLVFSGATVEGSLNLSTEMFYTVNPGSSEVIDVQIPTDLNTLLEIYDFAESNDLETVAYYTTESFTAYLSSEDVDYYLMKADSDEVILPSGTAVCKIHYLNSKGKTPNPITITEGYDISDAELPELADISAYSFDGWYLGSYKITAGYKVFCNITLEAKWIPNQYEIEYHLNGGTNSISNPSRYTIESDTISLENPYREGYNFDGWYESEDFSGDTISQIISGNYGKKKFYAKWSPQEYSIIYVLSEGINNSSNPIKYTIEQSIVFTKPIKTGYDFDGWYASEDFSGETITEIKTGSIGDKVLYAKWNPISYSISYNLNGGKTNKSNPKIYSCLSETINLNNPSRVGYSFCGWYENASFEGDSVSQIKSGSYGNKTFWAKWIPIVYSINYELNEGNNSVQNVKTYTIEDEDISLFTPEKLGYLFKGWYTNSTMTGTAVSTLSKGSYGNKTFYAKWDAITYPISYILGGGINSGSNIDQYTIETSTFNLNSPTKQGYSFDGWYTDGTYSVLANTTIEKGSVGEKVFYAKWIPIIFSISYNLNGGKLETNSNPSQYTIEDSTIVLQTPKKTGYSFAGWYDNYSFSGTQISVIRNGSYGNKVLYAKWSLESYSITYNLNGGNNVNTNPTSYTVIDNTIFLQNPNRLGYNFDGWYDNQFFNGEPITNINTSSAENKRLWAKWTPIVYSINYELNGGNNVSTNPSTFTIEDNQKLLYSPTKEGYEFGGWFDNSSFKGKSITEINKSSYGDITLFARWFIGIKFNASTDNLNSLDLSSYADPFELYVYGNINNNLLNGIAEKLSNVSVSATLNLKDAIGITNFDIHTQKFGGYGYEYYSIFYNCINLKGVILPSCLTSIGDYAFAGCPFLEIIEIPDSVSVIGSYTFSGCTSIQELYLPNLWEFGPHAFDGCLNKIIYDDSWSNWKVARTSYDSPVYIYVSLFGQYGQYNNMWWKH